MSKDELKETVSDKDKEKSAEPPSKALPKSVEEVSKIVPASETPVSETGGKDVAGGENSATKEKKEETAKDLLGTDIEEVKVRKAKGSKNVTSGICHVIATFNNTKVSFSDLKGNVISWSSSGKCNFRGTNRKDKRPGYGSRFCSAFPAESWIQGIVHYRCDSRSPQRMPCP
jgi:hypothetical protein